MEMVLLIRKDNGFGSLHGQNGLALRSKNSERNIKSDFDSLKRQWLWLFSRLERVDPNDL